MNDIEEKLWDYIDGNCSADEQASIKLLIETDALYKQKYTELLQLNADFTAMELDEPSMAFTYNVMEAIRTENALQPLKAGINKNIIWAIGAVFMLCIISLLAIAFKDVSWASAANDKGFIQIPAKMPQVSNYLNGTVVKVFIGFDIVLALFLTDSYLRKKLNSKAEL